ncbi:pentraxin fusion protein-like [Eleutherodactylus coqui]|uniref:pentraxin fusion protein-like n=1 Tax=Eleutherodactylus coqui TaxID=57060 RepID=UPI0034629612
MNLLPSLILLGSLALTLGCPRPGAPNIARNGEASQDSDLVPTSTAKYAIDGDSQTISHTKRTSSNWWKVDLKYTYRVSNVILTNRKDCCQERLIEAEVRVGNSPDNNNKVCGKVTSLDTLSFCCNGMVGRYVSVVIPTRAEYLTLAEVEVYGDLDTDYCRPYYW